MSKRIVLTAATILAAAGLAVPAAAAARHMLVGINDEANTLYGNPDTTFPILEQLRAQVLRVNLYWGGNAYGVAKTQPVDPADPGDPAYDWTLYDRFVRYASQYNIKVVFSILFTPGWANGGHDRRWAPTSAADLQKFAFAAAKRYSGTYVPPLEQQDPANSSTALPLPAVRFWTAWNEPNNPIWLWPQYKRVKGAWRMESARNYVRICNAVYAGVHATALSNEKVACGVTGPRGNDAPGTSRPSIDPISFMQALKRYGLKKFDAYAHHPYYGSRTEPPTFKPRGKAVQLGNIGTLITQVTKFWGRKRIWLTEFGYQTTPQDKLFGVSYAKQAAYLTQSFAIARKNPRVDMMLWFLVIDDTNIANGWQSGLLTATGVKKPAFTAFARLPH
ncbi:MAG: glycosyl hydrolase [Gaiellaceae bacterium]